VLIGGAAINRRFGRRILFLEDSGEPYTPGVFYCKDAFEGLETMDKLVDDARRASFLAEIVQEGYGEIGKAAPERTPIQSARRAALPPAPDVPTPPFWGARTIIEMPTEIVLTHLHKPELFRLSWGAKNVQGAEWAQISADFEARLARMGREASRDGWLRPQAVYGYFPANSDGDSVIIYDPALYASTGARAEIARFSFPRQESGEFLCLADYYQSVESGVVDVVALQVVTVGQGATEHFDALQAADQYSEAYYAHGLAVQAAEATAQYVNAHIRRELGLPEKRGKRYSWGYPACPDLEDHAIVLRLLPEAADRLGMALTAAYQWLPEQSTAAIFAHHPAAKYYAVGAGRLEQLMEG
jgi:5-methyltetrahydrofolate--homocysteine methyltransferase